MSSENRNAAPAVEGPSGEAVAENQLSKPYHHESGTATTARAEHSLAGRSANADHESRPAVTVPAIESHTPTYFCKFCGNPCKRLAPWNLQALEAGELTEVAHKNCLLRASNTDRSLRLLARKVLRGDL